MIEKKMVSILFMCIRFKENPNEIFINVLRKRNQKEIKKIIETSSLKHVQVNHNFTKKKD